MRTGKRLALVPLYFACLLHRNTSISHYRTSNRSPSLIRAITSAALSSAFQPAARPDRLKMYILHKRVRGDIVDLVRQLEALEAPCPRRAACWQDDIDAIRRPRGRIAGEKGRVEVRVVVVLEVARALRIEQPIAHDAEAGLVVTRPIVDVDDSLTIRSARVGG